MQACALPHCPSWPAPITRSVNEAGFSVNNVAVEGAIMLSGACSAAPVLVGLYRMHSAHHKPNSPALSGLFHAQGMCSRSGVHSNGRT